MATDSLEQTDDSGRTRRGPAFFVRVVIIAVVLLAVLAVAGDDELRASLRAWATGPDRWWQ